MATAKSPMMQQFEAAKDRCPGAIVLFRMGDFYELFGDDAREAAALLDLTLTSRDKGPDAVPMAGFPHTSSTRSWPSSWPPGDGSPSASRSTIRRRRRASSAAR